MAPPVPALVWVVAALALMEAGWMAFDGTRALLVGDYVTPQSGDHAGELGPWAALVEAVGIEPRSTFMKAAFAVYGALWLALIAAFLFQQAPWTWWAMLVAAVGALWYLPVGTLFSVAQIVLLNLASVRGAFLG